MIDPISAPDIIKKVIELGNTEVSCTVPCPLCPYDSFCDTFFKCYKEAIKFVKEEMT